MVSCNRKKNYSAKLIQNFWRTKRLNEYSKIRTKLEESITCTICQDKNKKLIRCGAGHGVCIICYENMYDNFVWFYLK